MRLLLPITLFLSLLIGCASTDIIESPKTGYVSEGAVAKDPELIWTSRYLRRPFDYLGLIKVKSWTYDGALARLLDAGKEAKADAIIDVHYERVGFLKVMRAFAVKYKE